MRSKRNNRFWAGTIALLLLFMQLFPFVVMAEGVSYEPPKYDVPTYQNPGVKAPQWDVPNMQPSEWQMPNVQPPNWGGELGTQPPQYQPPQPDIPAQDPSIQPPDAKPPGMDPVQLDPVSGEPVKSDESFVQSKGYDGLKFSFKDIMGGTLGYSAGLLEVGEIDMQQALYGKGLFLAGIGVKGLDLVLKDVEGWGTATGLAVDGFDLKAGYDSLKFVFQQTPNSRLAPFINSVTSFSNVEPPKFPGLFKGLNVGAAGISLVFDSIDTISNFGLAFDSSLSEMKQNEKFVEGVSSFGSVLMDAGVIASVIPALQPIAGGLFVAGAALWLLGRSVKWIDKMTDGAITRGIRSGFEKGFAWVKSLFA